MITINLMSWKTIAILIFIFCSLIMSWEVRRECEDQEQISYLKQIVSYADHSLEHMTHQQDIIDNGIIQAKGYKTYEQMAVVNKILSLNPTQLLILESNLLPFNPTNMPGED